MGFAAAVVALGVGIGLLYIVGCSQGSGCSDLKLTLLVSGGIGLSVFPFWPTALYLFRWRTGGSLRPGWIAPAVGVALMLYSFPGAFVFFSVGDWTDDDLVQVLVGAGVLGGWFALGFGLVSFSAARAMSRARKSLSRDG